MSVPASIIARRSAASSRKIAINAARFRQKIALMELHGPDFAKAAVKPMAEVFVDVLLKVSPRDTRRFVAGYAVANNEAGLRPVVVPAIQDSAKREAWVEALVNQVGYWLGRVEFFQNLIDLAEIKQGRPTKSGAPRARAGQTPSYRRYVRERNRAARSLQKAREELEEAAGSVGFLIFDRGRFAAGSERSGYGKSGRRLRTTVRTKVYGGRGWVESLGPISLVHLHNLEPHASIVAKSSRHGRPVDFALAAIRPLGAARIRAATADAMAAATGFKRGGPVRIAQAEPLASAG